MLVVYGYMMKGKILIRIERHQYLGVTIATDLNWKYYIENVVGKSNRALGFVRRNLINCLQEVKIQVCKVMKVCFLEILCP